MKSIQLNHFDINLSCNAHNWALPIGLYFGKKLFTLRFLCLEIEIDWISEKDIENEEVQDNSNV